MVNLTLCLLFFFLFFFSLTAPCHPHFSSLTNATLKQTFTIATLVNNYMKCSVTTQSQWMEFFNNFLNHELFKGCLVTTIGLKNYAGSDSILVRI